MLFKTFWKCSETILTFNKSRLVNEYYISSQPASTDYKNTFSVSHTGVSLYYIIFLIYDSIITVVLTADTEYMQTRKKRKHVLTVQKHWLCDEAS